MVDTIATAWETTVGGDEISRSQRLAIRLAAANTMRSGIDVVDTIFRLAGGAALYDHHPLQRCWRDLHAGTCHIFLPNNHTARGGQVICGEPTED
jgi:alkylation response protein AidB-like acyl-CoA dehydrogenase